MSLRNLRKLHGADNLPKPDDSSGDEYEPLYAKLEKNLFIDMPLSSESGTGEAESSDCDTPDSPDKKKKEKKKKRKNKKQRRRARAEGGEAKAMDEIEKSVMEVNAILGAPPPAGPADEGRKRDIRQVHMKHLNALHEMKRIFGSDDEEAEERPRNRGRGQNVHRVARQVFIDNENAVPVAVGLSMSLVERKDGCAYFTFTHNKLYQEMHKKFLDSTDHRVLDPMFSLYGETFTHVEAQIEIADFFFQKEEYAIASSFIDKAIIKMQAAFHPSFRVGDMNTRLEYKYIENRPFHVAILKHIHLLSNRACHRTALELAKMLMNLDPLDPLSVIFIIDVLAIRAREYEWLIRAVDFWKKERGAELMFNLRYSYALAHYHLACKGKVEMSVATQLLQDAILTFPLVGLHLMEVAHVSEAKAISKHPLFTIEIKHVPLTKKLRELFLLYANFATGRWREQGPLQWLVKTMLDTLALYDTQKETEDKATELREVTLTMLRVVPTEMLRHVCIITPMATLLLDAPLPEVPVTRLTDPLPVVNDTFDRHDYIRHSTNYRFHRNQWAADYMFFGDVLMPDNVTATIFSLIGNYIVDVEESSGFSFSDTDFDFD